MARRSDHSREQIKAMAIDAAIEILNRDGMAGLSTRKVASAIGYTVGTLYLVFENFDDLILNINALSLEDLESQISLAVEKEEDAKQQVHALAQAYLNYAIQNYARWSLMFNYQISSLEKAPEWFSDKVQQLFVQVLKPLKKIQKINESDKETPQADYKKALRVLWSCVHGTCELSLNNKLKFAGKVDAEEMLHDSVDNFLLGYINS